jgi:hypothetical protein
MVGERPSADSGAVGMEMEPAQQFAGDGAVGGLGLRGKQPGGKGDNLRRPARMTVATGSARLPKLRAAPGAGAQVGGAKLVNPAAADAEFRCESGDGKSPGPQFGKEVANQRGGKAAGQLWFFMTPPIAEGWILRIGADAGQG